MVRRAKEEQGTDLLDHLARHGQQHVGEEDRLALVHGQLEPTCHRTNNIHRQLDALPNSLVTTSGKHNARV
jgi:hypothetical protein